MFTVYTLILNGRWQYTLGLCSTQLKERRCEGGLKTHGAVFQGGGSLMAHEDGESIAPHSILQRFFVSLEMFVH